MTAPPSSPDREWFHVMYEGRIANRVGSLAASELGHVQAGPSRRGTRLTITCREPLSVMQLVHLLNRLGAEIESVHCRGVGSRGVDYASSDPA